MLSGIYVDLVSGEYLSTEPGPHLHRGSLDLGTSEQASSAELRIQDTAVRVPRGPETRYLPVTGTKPVLFALRYERDQRPGPSHTASPCLL